MKKQENRLKRKLRIRSKISGTKDVPRISVFRSPKYIYAQLVNDDKRVTLVSASSKGIKAGKEKGKLEVAATVGVKLLPIWLKQKKSNEQFLTKVDINITVG